VVTKDQVNAWRSLVPTLASLPAAPKRIVLHWTGGGSSANATDKAHYHFIVNQDGTIVKGVWPVGSNMRRVNGTSYAQHTGGFNSFSIGVSFAGMNSPATVLTERQVMTGLAFVALLCVTYKLDPTNTAQLFTHMEAWTLHKVKGTQNDTKSDIDRLKFRPELGKADVGPWLRKQTSALAAEIRGLL
jgi:hypothetical protein